MAEGANGGGRRVLLIGEGHLADATERALEAGGARVARLRAPEDDELRDALEEGEVEHVVIVSRSDTVSLRFALVAEHVRSGIPMVVTLFGHAMSAQLERAVENVTVISMADLVAPAFAGPCLDSEFLSVVQRPGGVAAVKAERGEPESVEIDSPGQPRLRWILAQIASAVRPFDGSARILMAGLAGFVAVLAIETVATALQHHLSPIDAFYVATKVAVTVGPSPAADAASPGFKLFSALGMLLTLAFAAVLTAGLVNRLLNRRLTGIIGRAAVPLRDHVIVVGLGQVGLRLCDLLRELRVPVVAVEQDAHAANVTRAKEIHLPVVIGSGSDSRLLRQLGVRRARALAAVTSDEMENIGIAVVARSQRDDLCVALRAGDGDATAETSSLFHIGIVRDVYRIGGTALAAAALGQVSAQAFPYQGTLYLVDREANIEPFVPVDGTSGPPPSRRRPARA